MSEREAHMLSWNKLLNGDEHALLEIYRQHYLGLMNYGKQIIPDSDFVNDCFTEMLLKLWERRVALVSVENVRSYLMTSIKRTILDKLEADKRRDSKHLELAKSLAESQGSYEEYLVSLQSDERLKTRISLALKKLSGRQLQLIQLKFFEDLDYDEIAERLGITKRTAYNTIYDAIAVLKEQLSADENQSFVTNLSVTGLLFLTIPTAENLRG
jgi:RNA polymerase sigma factor (sigma-70 family)